MVNVRALMVLEIQARTSKTRLSFTWGLGHKNVSYSVWYDFINIMLTITLSLIDGNASKSSNVKFDSIDISLTFSMLYSIGHMVIEGKTTFVIVSVWVRLPVSFFASFRTLTINIIQKAIVKIVPTALLITVMIFDL